MSKQYTPPADLLLKQYIRLAQSFTDRAVPQENVLATIASDWRYERALQGIRLLAQHHLGHLVQSLIAWRQHVNDDIKKNYSQNNVVNVQGVCKRAAMEILFLEAAIQVLGEFTPDFWKDRHFQTFFDSMQHVAFRWLLNSEEYVPHPELTQVRQHVVVFSGRIIGVLSRIKLSDVTVQFVKKLEERVNVRKELGPRTDQALARAQALKLCAGMRNIVLTFDSDGQLEQSTKFLQRSHPLTYTASVKKSQIHHALCEMLADILTPLVRKNQPHSCTGLSPGLLADWYNVILRLKNDIGQWANKHNKHIMVGYPLVTVLVCLVDNQNYNSLVDSMADFLAKQMKNKEYRSLCFKCLNQLVISSLVRNASAVSSPQVVAWLDKIVKPGLTNARKGGISMQEQQDFVADVADLNPEYCVGSIVPDLLQTDSLEAQLIALRALHLVATSVPRDSVAAFERDGNIPRRSTTLAASSSNNSSSNSKQMMQLPTGVIQDLIRNGQHPFELQGIAHLLPRVQQQIAQLLVQYHRAFGHYLSYGQDAVPKDKQAQVALFSAVIRLIPYFKPEQWSVVRPLDLLPSYTAHAENTVRTSAFDALMGTVRGCPALRGTVLCNMAVFLGSIPDDAALTIRECMLLLGNLMETWLSLLQEQRLSSSSLSTGKGGSSQEQQQATRVSKGESAQLSLRASKGESAGSAAAVANSLILDVHRLEGVLFMLLCSYDEAVRCDAESLLGLLRTLHQQLGDMAQQLGLTSLPHISNQAAAGGGGIGGAGSSSFGSSVSAQDEKSAHQAGSGGSGTGGGMFSRHKPAMSKDSLEFMATLGQLETPEAGMTYIMDVLEEVGTDVARRCYWDFGDWSDLWRETKHVPLDVSLQTVMSASDDVGKLRWLRCIVELARTACHMCPTSMGVAYLEMLHKLSRCLTRDGSGRLQIPADVSEGRRNEAWKVFVVVACVCPPSLRERVEKAAARKGAGLTARDLIRSLLATLTVGAGMPQQVCLMALGHASPEHYPVLFEELPTLIDEYQKPSKLKKGTAKPEEARKMVANVMRLVADTMPQNTLNSQQPIRSRYLEWLRETIVYLRSLPPFGEAFWEVSQVAYCLCAVCRCVASQLSNQLTQPLGQLRESSAVQRVSSNKSAASDASTAAASSGQLLAGDTGGSQAAGASGAAVVAGQPMTRKLLFEMFMHWCEEGQGRGNEYHVRLNAGINAALARIKDYETDMRESLKQELMQSAELLDQAARLAMAAMLQGPVFDTDARRPQGPVLFWIDRLLQAPPLGVSAGRVPCVPKDSVGRTALFNLLRSNLDMFSVCVDRCYDRDPRIATGSFQVVSEVYALNPVKVEPHVVLSLVLYKMVDSSPEVREDALHMLHVLSTREWQASTEDLAAAAAAGMSGAWQAREQQQEEAFALEAEGGSGTVVVLGALQDSYQQFQFQLASKLARDHPELSEALCEEMMTRQLELADKVSQHPVLACLGPWMENLTISPHWRGTWCERLLKSMYYVTLRHGDELPSEIENLWSKLANNRRNIIPILDFLATLGTHMAYQELNAMLEYLGVSKRICLYLARVGPQQTIDHLVYEISLQLHEEETVTAGGGGGGQVMASSMQDRGETPLQFAAVLLYEAPVQLAGRPLPQPQPAAAEAPGLLRSSASSWWAYSSTSSLGSAAATTPSAPFPSSSGMVAAAGVASSTGLLGSVLGASGSTHGGLAASFPPGPGAVPQYGSQGTSFTSDTVQSARGMRLSSTFTSALGNMIGGTSTTPPAGAPSSGLPELRESSTTGTGQSNIRRSMTDHSDSTRSSLSISGQNSSTALGGAAEPGSTSPAAAGAAVGLPSVVPLPRPINTKGGGTAGVATSGEFASSATAGAPASGNNSFNLGSYFSTGQAGADAQIAAVAGVSAQDEPAGWSSSRETDRRGGSPQPPKEPASPALRGLVTRPELALCLLTEVAYEHDEDFSSHLALLCHVSLLLVDQEEPLVAAAAQQLLVNCLYSLSAHHLEIMQEEGQHVDCLQATHLIKYLQSMKGRRLWSYEDLSLGQQQQLPSAIALAGLVQHCLNALSFEEGLQASWCEVSLEWALHAHSRHLACRSQQALRALRPPLTAEICSTLLLCLQQCLASASSSTVAREVALELLLTMRSLLEVLPARKLLLYPQVFWSSLSLLFSSYVHIYQQAIILLSTCLQQLALHDSTTQNVLLAAAPAAEAAELQQLLSSCQARGNTWLDTAKSGRSTPNGDFAVGSRPTTAHVQSPNTAGSDAAGGAGNTAAAAAVSSSIQSFVGGSDTTGSRPMHWAVGQLLPWPERGPDGPAHHMIALQQVLFKGLLFQDTQLPTVQLLSLLAKGLCQLPPSAATPVQGPLNNSRRPEPVWGSRDQSVHDDDSSVQHRGSRHRASMSVDNVLGSRATSGTISRSNSRDTPAGVSDLLAGTGVSVRTRSSGRFVGTSLQQEHLLEQPESQQQQQQHTAAGIAGSSSAIHSRGVSLGGSAVSGEPASDPAPVSRSAPELRNLAGPPDAADTQAPSDSSSSKQTTADTSGAKKGPAGPAAALNSSWGAWHSLVRGSTVGANSNKNTPGSRAAFQSLLGHRHAQLLVSIASIVPFFCSQLGQLEPDSELFEALQECMLMLSAACCAQGLTQLGSKLQQFTASLNINSHLSSSSNHSSSQRYQQPHQQQQDPGTLRTSHGQPALGKVSMNSSTSSISLKQPGGVGASGGLSVSRSQPNLLHSPNSPANSALVHLLQGLCLQLSRALLPIYADWLLRFWMGVLLLPGAAALHPHVLLLMRCLFDTPGLQLGPAVALLLDSSFISPIVNLSQGPLCQYALEVLDAIIQYASSSDELQQYQQQQQQQQVVGASSSSTQGFSSASPLAAGTAAAGSGSPGQQGVDLQGLAACLLPQLDVVELLQRVLSSFPVSKKRRKYRLLPFLGESAVGGHEQTKGMAEE